MKNQLSNDAAYELARLQSRLTLQIYQYIGVHTGLWIVWYVLPHSYHLLALWPVYSMAAWGINLIFLAGEALIYEHNNKLPSWSGPQAG
jgi:hypothetical protein